ncbi:GGDEF domain-containing protein [Qipengyuania marisflavi]|uniref:diguanylate cyclase n=1 Tax=Qipengyuania marisflavi TaxID=2486356 RepID=A0A5S3PF33_9SPHN|nr:GGDEF domain-containing protein [Qipengyuania marisflavi]TMM50200.1 GGDEF domain-containing protein [Qipengyuania marisflavi]
MRMGKLGRPDKRDEAWRAERRNVILASVVATEHGAFVANIVAWFFIAIAAFAMPNADAFVLPVIGRLIALCLNTAAFRHLAKSLHDERAKRLALHLLSGALALGGASWAFQIAPLIHEPTLHPAVIVVGGGSFVAVSLVLSMVGSLKTQSFAFLTGFLATLAVALMHSPTSIGLQTGTGLAGMCAAIVFYAKSASRQRWNAAEMLIQNRRLGERLQSSLDRAEYLSKHDPLTGLYNRRALFETNLIDPEDSRRKYALLVDLDHFKQLNDQFGHVTGDRVLVGVAETFRAILHRLPGKGHFAVRLGGEEFAIVLSVGSEEQARVLAERIRFMVALVAGRIGLQGAKTTASIGLTHFDQGERIDDVFSRADAAMYRAKSSGRNQVRAHAA